MRSRAIGSLLVVTLLGLGACGAPVSRSVPADTAQPSTTAPPTYAAPTTAPARSCAWALTVQEPVASSPEAPGSERPSAQGDMPPNHVDNRSWRQRRPLTVAQTRAARAVAERLRPALLRRCGQGDFSPPSLEADLRSAGWEHYAFQPQSAAGEARTAVEFGLSRSVACVVGTSQPGHVDVVVGGTIMDGGCAEPVSH